jgi:hypothetical protein
MTAAGMVSSAQADAGPDTTVVPVDGYVVASGTVQDNGAAMAGATVTAVIWPNAATLDALPDGAEVPTLTVGSTQTASNGTYVIHDPSVIGASYKEADGATSVETDVTTADGRTMTWDDSITFSATSGGYVLPAGGGLTASSSNSQLDFGTGLAYDAADPGTTYDAGSGTVQDAVDASDPDIGTCIPFWVATSHRLNMQPEHFMNVDAWSGAPGTAEQSENASHTLGVGVSADGKFDDIKVGGKMSLSLNDGTGGGDTAANLVNEAVYNAVNLRDFDYECAGHVFKGERKTVSVGDFLDRDFFHSISHTYYYSSCSKKGVGDHAFTSSAHQVTYGGGLDIGPINVSAQSGFSSATKITFVFNKVGYFCGSSNLGPLQSAQVSTQNIN